MIVTGISAVDKKRSRIFIDEEFAFVLYMGEIRKFRLEINKEISQQDYDEIVGVILVKRAKLRCMNLLKSKDYTEYKLRVKLKEGGYPPSVIDSAIEYLKSYHYIDDVNYVHRYLEIYSNKKSKRTIEWDLQQKGIKRELIGEFLESMDIDETEAIMNIYTKKYQNKNLSDDVEKRKMFAYFYSKGFSYSKVWEVLAEFLYK